MDGTIPQFQIDTDAPAPPRALKGGVRAVLLGVLSAGFFAVTFVLNRSMANAHGHWAWSSSLRYYCMLPLLAILLSARRQWPQLRAAIAVAPIEWLKWGTVGFVFFYTCLTAAGTLAPAWLVAGTFPITILAGVLLAPLLYNDRRRIIPISALGMSAVILAGVCLLQIEQASKADAASAAAGLLLVIGAAVAYPLGNRKMMLALERRRAGTAQGIDAFVRLTGMTIGSIPAWLLVSAYGYARSGWPSSGQMAQAGVVALSSGIFGTSLFFAATDSVARDPVALAAVEATQAMQLPFTFLLEYLLLGTRTPGPLALAGFLLIALGMAWYARLASRG